MPAAFAASGILGAIGGGLLALLSTYLDPTQFGITQAVYDLAIAVVGGLRRLLAPWSVVPCSCWCLNSCRHSRLISVWCWPSCS